MGASFGQGSSQWAGLWLSGQGWARSTLLTMCSLGEAQRVLSTWGWEHGKGYVHGAKEQQQAGE